MLNNYAKSRQNVVFLILVIVISTLLTPFLPQKTFAAGTTYYVDNVSGSDANSGTLTGSAWKTISKVNSSTFQAGDSILFKRGGIWKEQLVVPSSGGGSGYITFGAYGTGNKPILDGSLDWDDPNKWIHEGNNIWSTKDLSTTTDRPFKDVGNVILNSGTGYKKIQEGTGSEELLNNSFDTDTTGWGTYINSSSGASGSAARTTTSGEYFSSPAAYKISMTNNGTTSSDVQFYSNVSTNPISITEGNTYVLTFKAKSSSLFTIPIIRLIKGTSPYTVYSNSAVAAVKDDWNSYSLYFTATASASDARINFSLGNSLPDSSQLFIDDISLKTIRSTDMLDAQGDYIYDKDTNNLKMYSTANPADIYSTLLFVQNMSGISLVSKDYLKFDNLSVKNFGNHGFNGGSSDYISIKNCDISWIGGAFQSGTIRYGNAIQFWLGGHDINVENNRIWEIYDAGMTPQGSSTSSMYNQYYRNNVVWNAEYGIEFWQRPDTSTASDIYFENNTIVDSGRGWGHSQRPDGPNGLGFNENRISADMTKIYFRNNVVVNSTERLVKADNPNMTWLNMDYNYYHNSLNTQTEDLAKMNNFVAANNSTNPTYYRINQFQNWQNDTGYDQHTVLSEINNSFYDYSGKDFVLSSVSGAIDKGVNTDRTNDVLGNPIYGTPDIGAYEYQPPFTMGVNQIDISGARIYGDGKFRNLNTSQNNPIDLKVTPQSVSFQNYSSTQTRPEWLDITDISWSTSGDYMKQWTEASTYLGLNNTIHTVGEMKPNKNYAIKVDGVVFTTVSADSNGEITFTYTGGYQSGHTFTIERCDTPIYRLYNTLNGAYLYTRGSADREHVLSTWPEFEYTDGVPAFYAPLSSQDGFTPIYRLYNTKNGMYLYTRGEADRQHVMSTWPEFEFTDGVPAFYAPLTARDGYTPIYRLYNTLNGAYLYTRGSADRDHVLSTWPEFEFTDGVPAFYAPLE